MGLLKRLGGRIEDTAKKLGSGVSNTVHGAVGGVTDLVQGDFDGAWDNLYDRAIQGGFEEMLAASGQAGLLWAPESVYQGVGDVLDEYGFEIAMIAVTAGMATGAIGGATAAGAGAGAAGAGAAGAGAAGAGAAGAGAAGAGAAGAGAGTSMLSSIGSWVSANPMMATELGLTAASTAAGIAASREQGKREAADLEDEAAFAARDARRQVRQLMEERLLTRSEEQGEYVASGLFSGRRSLQGETGIGKLIRENDRAIRRLTDDITQEGALTESSYRRRADTARKAWKKEIPGRLLSGGAKAFESYGVGKGKTNA